MLSILDWEWNPSDIAKPLLFSSHKRCGPIPLSACQARALSYGICGAKTLQENGHESLLKAATSAASDEKLVHALGDAKARCSRIRHWQDDLTLDLNSSRVARLALPSIASIDSMSVREVQDVCFGAIVLRIQRTSWSFGKDVAFKNHRICSNQWPGHRDPGVRAACFLGPMKLRMVCPDQRLNGNLDVSHTVIV